MATKIVIEEAVAHNALSGIVVRALSEMDKATPTDEGTDYKSLYYFLLNGITDIINSLKQLQCEAEEHFVEQTKEESTI